MVALALSNHRTGRPKCFEHAGTRTPMQLARIEPKAVDRSAVVVRHEESAKAPYSGSLFLVDVGRGAKIKF